MIGRPVTFLTRHSNSTADERALLIAELENNNMKNMNSKWTSLLAAAFLIGTASAASAIVDTNGDDSMNSAYAIPPTTQGPNTPAGAYAFAPDWQNAPVVTQPRNSRMERNVRPQMRR